MDNNFFNKVNEAYNRGLSDPRFQEAINALKGNVIPTNSRAENENVKENAIPTSSRAENEKEEMEL